MLVSKLQNQDKKREGQAHRSKRATAYIAYAEVVCEEQRRNSRFFCLIKACRWSRARS